MRFCAALFRVIACGWAILSLEVRALAVVAVRVGKVSFGALRWGVGRSGALRGIAVADMVTMVPLAIVAWAAFGTEVAG